VIISCQLLAPQTTTLLTIFQPLNCPQHLAQSNKLRLGEKSLCLVRLKNRTRVVLSFSRKVMTPGLWSCCRAQIPTSPPAHTSIAQTACVSLTMVLTAILSNLGFQEEILKNCSFYTDTYI
jgi:hypothetical protein